MCESLFYFKIIDINSYLVKELTPVGFKLDFFFVVLHSAKSGSEYSDNYYVLPLRGFFGVVFSFLAFQHHREMLRLTYYSEKQSSFKILFYLCDLIEIVLYNKQKCKYLQKNTNSIYYVLSCVCNFSQCIKNYLYRPQFNIS